MVPMMWRKANRMDKAETFHSFSPQSRPSLVVLRPPTRWGPEPPTFTSRNIYEIIPFLMDLRTYKSMRDSGSKDGCGLRGKSTQESKRSRRERGCYFWLKWLGKFIRDSLFCILNWVKLGWLWIIQLSECSCFTFWLKVILMKNCNTKLS